MSPVTVEGNANDRAPGAEQSAHLDREMLQHTDNCIRAGALPAREPRRHCRRELGCAKLLLRIDHFHLVSNRRTS